MKQALLTSALANSGMSWKGDIACPSEPKTNKKQENYPIKICLHGENGSDLYRSDREIDESRF